MAGAARLHSGLTGDHWGIGVAEISGYSDDCAFAESACRRPAVFLTHMSNVSFPGDVIMPRIRLVFDSLTLYQDEEANDTNMAMYATVTDATGAQLASFRWNNGGHKVDEVATYSLAVDPQNPNTVDFELPDLATLTVSAFTHDDNSWPDAGTHENDLGSASVVIDGRAAASLGDLLLGPTSTDNGNTGYDVTVQARVVAPPQRAQVRLSFRELLLLQDEEAQDTHMAVYVRALAPAQGGVPAIDQELLRWNNDGNKVDEVNAYPLTNGGVTTTIDLTVGGPTLIWAEAYANDDENWPSADNNENFLGRVLLVVDPVDPLTLGARRVGPSTTDNRNPGFVLTLASEVLPPDATPDLGITGVEVTQAVQRFHSTLGTDNSLPLVAGKTTLVRVYLDSGIDITEGGGTVAGVTGTLTMDNGAFSTGPLTPVTARPAATVDRGRLDHSLNFRIPAGRATGKATLVLQATVGASVSNPVEVPVEFEPSPQLNILMVRVRWGAVAVPTDAEYYAALNKLPLVYPIADDPAASLVYWILPGSEVVTANHDLSTLDGMHAFLGDLEDIQEESADYKKLYALVSDSRMMNRFGTSRRGDNVALGHSFIMESVAHELGHVYGLHHAPCGNVDEDLDDKFVPPDGSLGDVGVDPDAMIAFPASTADFMSYCGDGGATAYENLWVSGYHWQRLWNRLNGIIFPLLPAVGGPGGPEERPADHEAMSHNPVPPVLPILESRPYPGPYVRVRGTLGRGGSVSWSPCLRTPTAPAAGVEGEAAAAAAPGYTVSSESATGEVLATTGTEVDFPFADAPTAGFTARLPYAPATHRVVLRRDGQELGALVVPPEPPFFHLSSPVSALQIDTAGVLHLQWRQHSDPAHPAPPATYTVRFTNAAGDIQLRPAVNLQTESFDLDLRDMPGDEQCMVQVIATNGYHTSYVQTPAFALPVAPPRILLGATEGPLLHVQGVSANDGPLTGTAITWQADGEPATVTGGSFDVRSLGPGPHTIRTQVTDARGQSAAHDFGSYDGTTGRPIPPAPGL